MRGIECVEIGIWRSSGIEGLEIGGWRSRGKLASGIMTRGMTARDITARGSTARGITARGTTVRGITARGITARGITARVIRCDEIELRESTNTNKPTQALLGARGQEEGTNCSASMQTSTIDKDKVSGSKSRGQKLGADTATPGEHKPQ